jgi:cyclopropane fatty-acyl-phospholipid synthase-like methyltransferase
MSDSVRGFWQTYTPRNIWYEIIFRLTRLRERRKSRRPVPKTEAPYDGSHAQSVGRFYDEHHDAFMKVYGPVIQAFRTKDVSDLLNYQMKSIGFQPGQRALDAGCGVAAPAIHFARHAQLQVDAITISKTQCRIARQNVAAAKLESRIVVAEGDYHKLTDYFPEGVYDVVYFLESFGHSKAKRRLVETCWVMLKPGGTLYIKDLFRRIPLRPEHSERINREIRKISQVYHYEVGDLNAVLDDLRRTGFMVSLVKSIDLNLDDFEDLAISNEFQELTGLGLIENWSEYVFPVDFFEIKCIKPQFNLEERLDRHFLQSMYHRQGQTSS